MTLRRFGWMLRTQGGNVAAWPRDDRAMAFALLRSDAGARTLLADALAAEGEDVAPGPVDVDAVALCRMQAVVRAALVPATPVARVLRGVALAACVVAGAYLGVTTTAEPDAAAGPVPTIEATTSATVLAALDP